MKHKSNKQSVQIIIRFISSSLFVDCFLNEFLWGFALALAAVLHRPCIQVHLKRNFFINSVFEPKRELTQAFCEIAQNSMIKVGINAFPKKFKFQVELILRFTHLYGQIILTLFSIQFTHICKENKGEKSQEKIMTQSSGANQVTFCVSLK